MSIYVPWNSSNNFTSEISIISRSETPDFDDQHRKQKDLSPFIFLLAFCLVKRSGRLGERTRICGKSAFS